MASSDHQQAATAQLEGERHSLAPSRERLIVGVAILLAGLFFVLDLLVPLGVADAVLYSAVVFLSAASRYRRMPVVTASACSLLTFIAAVFSPRVPGLPVWFEWSNHLLSLFGVWVPVAFVYQHRRTEWLLKEVKEQLERRVEQRTSDLAASRQALEPK